MSVVNSDVHGLLDDEKPILERLETFVTEVQRLGYKTSAIGEGTLDEHSLSLVFKIPPQIIRMYFGLHLCDDDERKFLAKNKLDTAFIGVLMLIEPEIRKEVYKHVKELLEKKYPIWSTISFLDNYWELRTKSLYGEVKRLYWAAVSSYLKDVGIENGTINKALRVMLLRIKMRDATEKELKWLERAIIHDCDQNLGVFTAKPLRAKFPKAVESVERYIEDCKRLGLLT